MAAVVGITLFVAALLFFIWGDGFRFLDVWRHQNPGAFDRLKMEAIVKRARLKHLAPDEQKEYKLDKTAELGPVPDPPGEEDASGGIFYFKSHVFARVSKQGKLTVLIVTNDMNHAGTYGFVYSEEPVKQGLSEFDGWRAEGQIDDHWWKVGNNEN